MRDKITMICKRWPVEVVMSVFIVHFTGMSWVGSRTAVGGEELAAYKGDVRSLMCIK